MYSSPVIVVHSLKKMWMHKLNLKGNIDKKWINLLSDVLRIKLLWIIIFMIICVLWHTPIIPETQEAEAGGCQVQS